MFPIPAPPSGALAEYRFDDGSGASLLDYSGNTYTGTLSATATPAWISGGGLQFAANSYVTIPTQVSGGAVTVIAAIGQSGSVGVAAIESILGPVNSSGLMFCLDLARPMTIVLGVGIRAFANEVAYGVASLVTFISDVSADSLYFGTTQGSYANTGGSAGDSRSGQYVLGNANNNGFPFNNSMYYFMVWPRKLTPTEQIAAYAYIKARLANRSKVNRNVMLVGNSLSAGTANPTPSDRYFNQIQALLSGLNYTLTNQGVNAETTPTETANAVLDGPYVACFDLRAIQNLAIQWETTNDIFVNGVTGAQAYANSVLCHKALQALGWDTAIGTMIDRVGLAQQKNDANALYRANWPSFANLLIDFASDPRLGADGANANLTYFLSGGVHTNFVGNAIEAQIAYQALTGYSPTNRRISMGMGLGL